ncbi:hypothetical protein TNCV_3483911 [Trichonephila clavipes]|nr:hypothetical protein TNCV_3483911 [Trichonephila clavipes]
MTPELPPHSSNGKTFELSTDLTCIAPLPGGSFMIDHTTPHASVLNEINFAKSRSSAPRFPKQGTFSSLTASSEDQSPSPPNTVTPSPQIAGTSPTLKESTAKQ